MATKLATKRAANAVTWIIKLLLLTKEVPALAAWLAPAWVAEANNELTTPPVVELPVTPELAAELAPDGATVLVVVAEAPEEALTEEAPAISDEIRL